VRNPESVGPDFDVLAVRPRCLNSIIVHRDIAGYLNGKLLDRGGLKGNAFRRVRSDPVSDVILSHGRGTDKWPANKILVPQRAILIRSLPFTYSQYDAMPRSKTSLPFSAIFQQQSSPTLGSRRTRF